MTNKIKCVVGMSMLFIFAVYPMGLAQVDVAGQMLFPADLPGSQWAEFKAVGFSKPLTGVIYRQNNLPCCGVPLGG